MKQVTVTEAKNKLTELIVSAEFGETISIQRHGRTVAQLIQAATRKVRTPGSLAHKQVFLKPDWDEAQNDQNAWLAGDV